MEMFPSQHALRRRAFDMVCAKSGMIMPILGLSTGSRHSRRKTLADALFTKTQQRVLRVLFGHPERSFCASELIREAGTGSGAVGNWIGT
jgi:hypothetical protein